jgi:predicted permease
MQSFLQNLRYALRTLRRSPGATFVIIASLSLGIGANTAVFSVVNALLLQPLPYPDANRLVVLWLRSPGINIPQDWPSPGQYVDIQTENRSFAEMSISQGRSGTLLGLERPERVEGLRTSSGLFRLLGATPLHGRLLLPEEDVPGKPPVVVLSHDVWRRLFNADPGVVGRSITLNGFASGGSGEARNQFTVVGVLGPDFMLNDEVMPTVASIRQMDIFLPLPWGADAVTRRGDENYNLMARLKDGVSVQQAQADIDVIAARIRDKDKRDRTFTISVVPLRDQVVGDVRRAVLVLLGSVGLVLLIACANVANLLLTRATGRQKEVAVRTALGAGWPQIVRQLLTESVLLALISGAVGLLIARVSLDAMRAINPGNIPRLEVIGMDRTVLLFTFGVSLLTGIVFGLAPALRAVRVNLHTTLKAGGRNTQGEGGFHGSRRRLRSALVVAEVALALMLLIGAGLLIRSFVRLQNVSPGFNPANVISMRMGASGRQFPNRETSIAYSRQLHERLAAVPGVESRGAVSSLPFTSSVGWGFFSVEGFTPAPGQELQVDQRGATTDYFRTMQIPLITGRFFNDFDLEPKAEAVVIIDEAFAKRFWPQGDAVGKRVWNDPKFPMTVVGVVGAVKQYGLDVEPRIVAYFPAPAMMSYQVARTTADPAATAAAIVKAIHEVDPTVPIHDIRTMEDRMKDSMARRRFAMLMLGAFSAFALLLAVIGVFGVLSHLVTQSTHDIGLRMALGAERTRIVSMVVRQGMELTVAGVIAGLAGAVVFSRVMATLLFDVSVTDWATFSVVPTVLIGVALLASYVPALRATRVDPVVALRDE